MKDNEIKAYEMTPERLERLRAMARGSFGPDDDRECVLFQDDLLWFLQRAAPEPAGAAPVFWDGTAHWWTPDNVARHGPFDGPDSLDDAIGAARAAGFKIVAVNRTRGTMPAVSPPPLPVEERPRQSAEAESSELIARARAACTCPKSGPNAPTVGMMRRPAIIVGHAPLCPALPIIWGESAEQTSDVLSGNGSA